MDFRWTCGCCGRTYDTIPLDLGFGWPDAYFDVPEADRATRVFATGNPNSADLCAIESVGTFIRGVLEVPIIGRVETLNWGVWTSLSDASRDRVLELWNEPAIDPDEPARFGWLCNHIAGYPPPDEIKCHVHIRPGNLRPLIVLEPTDYPLAVEQRDGITIERVQEIVSRWHR